MTAVLRYAAFTDAGRGGNPAGVVLDATDLDPVARLRIAADVGYSETAFVEPAHAPRHYRVRYFSPLAEVAFCGHATIATAVALADRDGPGRLVLETLAGEIVVETIVDVDGVTATLTSPATRTREANAAEATTRSTPWAGLRPPWMTATQPTSRSRVSTIWSWRSESVRPWPRSTTTSSDSAR